MDMDRQAILSTFERTINGKNKKFCVRILPDDQKEKAIHYFREYFFRDEPMSKCAKIFEDEKSVEFVTACFWRVVEHNMSLACFVEHDNGQHELVAANFCFQSPFEGELFGTNIPERFKLMVEVFQYVHQLKDIKKELGVTKYLSSIGLLTIPEYRGMNIGLEILKTRKLLCEKLGLPATVTQFTAPQSQRLAEKVGFKDLVSVTYDDIEKCNPSLKFPNINEYSKSIRNMYILYRNEL